MMSLTKLIVVVDADCDVHDLHEVVLAGARQHRLRPRPDASSRVPSTISTTPRTSSSGAARRASTRRGSWPEEGYTRDGGWPNMVESDPETADGSTAAGRSTGCERSAAAAVPAARPHQGLPAPGDDRALGLRAALRVHRRADRDVPAGTSTSTGASCCWSPSRWWACAPSRWPPTGSSTARSTPVTRAPPAASWSPARSRCATAWTGALVALAVFLGAAALLNPLCLALAPIAVVPMVVYPYGKRFTDFPHAILGLAQAMGPIGAWIAVTGEWSWDAVILGLAVGIWIGGFDLIYACQDVAADRAHGRASVPARFGIPAALYGARALPRRDDRAAAGLVRAGHGRGRVLLAGAGDRRGGVRLRAHDRAARTTSPA